MTTQPPLTSADLEVLEFELTQWGYRAAGKKDTAIRERFGISRVRYDQRLLWIADHPDAAAYNPELVNRIHRRRARHLTARTEGMSA